MWREFPIKGLLLLISFLFLPVKEIFAQKKQTLPVYFKTQFAGDIGFVSVGVGKSFFNGKMESDLFLGYLPESIGGDRIVTAAIKGTYLPVKEIPFKFFGLEPVVTGLQLSYTFGDDYFLFLPDNQYPKNYYRFPTAAHLYYFIGSRVNFSLNKKIQEVGLYYEAGANAEYIVSYIQNPAYLNPAKIFNLALGLKLNL